ncbi:YppG family protein [Aquibacillus rhizosphaerae]|uniref:YppG family protein n=1 Tax=Aquibacillus rhizosphaerae TaxID=3051431 RepID=A0ABT7LBB7_9BACI|nr:YppG family protein [Aquibacillus sp. LR5S19]MDL4842704.1 YppG family protein [Aquibacillus sp. LR5S19]
MFPPPRPRQQRNRFIGSYPRANHPLPPRNQYIQQDNPFQKGFLMTPNQRIPQGHRRAPQNQGQLSQGLASLIKDENGRIDMKKVGAGVQNVMGVVNQAGPVVNMVRGFFR